MCIKGNKKKILMYLFDKDYARPTEISRGVGIHKNTVSYNLGLLKKEGLVYCINEEYSIPRLYRLTSKGKKEMEK